MAPPPSNDGGEILGRDLDPNRNGKLHTISVSRHLDETYFYTESAEGKGPVSSGGKGRKLLGEDVYLRRGGGRGQERGAPAPTLTTTSRSSSSRGAGAGGSKSLANDVNSGGGNDVMWRNAVEYLKTVGVLDFNNDVLQVYAPKERLSCMLQWTQRQRQHDVRDQGGAGEGRNKSSFPSTSALPPSSSTGLGLVEELWASLIGRVASSLQSVYDRRCGVQYCPLPG